MFPVIINKQYEAISSFFTVDFDFYSRSSLAVPGETETVNCFPVPVLSFEGTPPGRNARLEIELVNLKP
jgi:hypothetical protein